VKLVIGHAALAELQKVAAFYTAQSNAELGLALVAEFERATNLIFLSPHWGGLIRGTRRHYPLRKFP